MFRHFKTKKIIKDSGLFDSNYYLLKYPDIRAADIDPLTHFVKFGWREKRNPSADFNTKVYLERFPELLSLNINPLVHFIQAQRLAFESRDPSQTAQLLTSHPSKTEVTDTRFETVYRDLFEVAKGTPSDDFVPYDPDYRVVDNPALDLIAFYLPQFHPFPENDLWWGKGFTEWRNVTKALPQFVGHYQPRLPGDLGFYDLRVPEVQEEQARLAQQFGIKAFCFHYYWFSGKRLMEKPLESFVNNPNISLPFCVCWANDNWTRRWDGSANEILIAQEHNFELDKKIIHDLVPLFENPRYYRIEGRPLLVVYNAGIMDDIKETIAYWRDYTIKQGLPNPYIIAAQTFSFLEPESETFDATVEFPPHHIGAQEISDKVSFLQGNEFTGQIFDYAQFSEVQLSKLGHTTREHYHTIVPGWDNEARRPGKGFILKDSSPELYGEWLKRVGEYTLATKTPEKRLVFINAWNEWAEATYLEPDLRYGYAYLQKTAEIVNELSGVKTDQKRVSTRTDIDETIPGYVRSVRFRWPFISETETTYESKAVERIQTDLDDLLEKVNQEKENAEKISIIIPVYNHVLETINCLKSIAIADDPYQHEIIVIDDGSSDLTQTLLSDLKHITYIRNEENLGFLRSCNKAAKHATGDYICFLNNDTMVLESWLERIVQTFNQNQDAGLVGSKLYYPDGSLQEVGGLIWNDASGINYGREDDPRKPEYGYLREPDYCSGAAIFLPMHIWKEMHGFDSLFVPAYYEDTDLAFRVRQAGYKVLVQPLSKVIHLEGITSGTDLSSGAKRYQVVNKEKFLERWKDVLAKHAAPHQPDWTSNTHGKKKRILLVDVCTPKPDVDSGSIDTYNYLLSFQRMGYEVVFYSVVDSQLVDRYVTDLQSQGIHCLNLPGEGQFWKFLEKYGGVFDYVMLFRVHAGGQFMDAVKSFAPDAKVIFNTVDLHFLREQRQSEISTNQEAITKNSVSETEQLEAGLMKTADLSILVSEFERELLSKLYPEIETRVMPLPREIPGRKNGFTARADIAFVGGYLHKPNVDAIDYFVKEVWPLIENKLPGVKFKIVGSNMPEDFSQYASESVELVGFVDDLGDVFDNVRLSVAPLRFGAGIKGKVVSSLSYGLPCVASSIAAEGMNLTDGVNILQSDDPQKFADLVYEAYTDEAKWTKLSDAGLDFVHERHAIESFEKRLQEIVTFLG